MTHPSSGPGVLLEDLTWVEAEPLLSSETVVVIPIGAASKEHGPHLPLKNDLVMAEYLRDRILKNARVVIAPTMGYHFYPAFLEYPGSVSLRLETARDVTVDICRSLAGYGPRRFYALNTGVSTMRALEAAARLLEEDGVLLQFTDILHVAGAVVESVSEQEGGTHADEIETSMMLYIAPHLVDMSKAVKEFNPGRGLTRRVGGAGAYSASGVYGDATLASREKGEKIVEAMVTEILADIERVRGATPPPAKEQ